MKLADLMTGISVVQTTADMETEIKDIKYDSRNVEKGDLFVAIVGFETDGHEYIKAAEARGAAAVVCEKRPETGIPYILVENSRQALAAISASYFGNPAHRMKIIGVTGTNGKTTTTFLLKEVLEKCENTSVGLIGTNRNMIGSRTIDTERTTPESYDLHKLFREMADSGCEYVVMEVSSHSLVLNRVHGIEFEIGIFTNLTQDHLDFHGTMENYAQAKAEMFKLCKMGIINIDDDYAGQMMSAAQCPVFTFSTEKDEADLLAKDIKLGSDSVKFLALIKGEIQRVSLKIPGEFSVYNALGVIAAAYKLGISLKDISGALAQAEGVSGRVEVAYTNDDYTMLIDYAHTPDALENVLNAVRGFSLGRTVILFGCGGDRDSKKRPLMGEIAARLADFVIVTSDNPRTEEPARIIEDILQGMKDTKTPYAVIENRREAITYAMNNAQKDDVIVLAGKGHETYQIVGETKYHMDEREIIAENLESGA